MILRHGPALQNRRNRECTQGGARWHATRCSFNEACQTWSSIGCAGPRKNAARRFLLALAGGLRVSGLRGFGALRTGEACPWQCNACPRRRRDSRHDLRGLQARSGLVPRHAPTPTKQGISALELSRRLDTSASPRLGDAPQAPAGGAVHLGQAARRPHRGRCLSRRRSAAAASEDAVAPARRRSSPLSDQGRERPRVAAARAAVHKEEHQESHRADR